MKMNDLNLILLPKIIYVDFELVIHSALLIVFPNAIKFSTMTLQFENNEISRILFVEKLANMVLPTSK